MLDQITHLFRLRTILEEGSLRRASEKLNVTQPALSRSLAQLENYFGNQLVERHAKGVRATPFGERVLSVSNRIERYWEIAEQELRTEVSERKTILHIGGGPVWRSGVLSGILAQLQQLHPDVVIEFTTPAFGRTAQHLKEGQLDVAFTGVAIEGGNSPGFEKLKLTEVTNRIFAREDHPVFELTDEEGNIDPTLYANYPWIVYSELPAYRAITEHAVAEHLGTRPPIRFVCQNLLSVLTLLQQSDALCLLPEMATHAVTTPRLVPLPMELEANTADIGMIFRKELWDWPPMQTLVELCRAKFHTS